MKQGAYWTDPANQVVWGWVERCHVGIGGWGENMRVRVEDRKGAWELVPERTCELNGTISCEWHTTSTTFYTHSLSCGHNVTTTEPEPPCYCEECGAKVVDA